MKYLIITNISKRHNVVDLFYAAKSFEFVPIMVGASNLYSELPFPIQQEMVWLPHLRDLKEKMQKEGITIIGIEISKDSVDVMNFSFPSNVAIMPGNEGTGLNVTQRGIADHLVYIPHYGEGTASLNVHVATTMVLYQAINQL